MKKIKLFLLLLLWLPFSIKAITIDPSYNVTDYNTKIKVGYDNKLDITEDITTFFNMERHGLERLIPLENTIYPNGNYMEIKTNAYNIRVDNNFTVYEDTIDYDKYKVVRIGDPNKLITGEQKYNISYGYDLGYDFNKGKDLFYFNIIGSYWNVSISDINFEIEMPSAINKSDISFTSGPHGSTNNENVLYEVNGNKIIGSYKGTLEANDALTICIQLPDNYFELPTKQVFGMSISINTIRVMLLIITHILLAVSIVLLFLYGKGTNNKVSVTPYPPNHFNGAETGFFSKEKLDYYMLSSYLFSLANKGYIKISEVVERAFGVDKKSISIKKIKDYKENNPIEESFMNSLFSTSNEVGANNIGDNMAGAMFMAQSSFTRLLNNSRLYADRRKRKHLLNICFYTVVIISNVILWFVLGIEDMQTVIVIKMLIELGIVALVPNWDNKIAPAYLVFVFILLYAYGSFLPLCLQNQYIQSNAVFYNLVMSSLYCLVVALIMAIISKRVSSKTPQGNQITRECQLFVRFIKEASADDIASVVSSNNNYFYDILPHMLALDIDAGNINKFSNIPFQAPIWYEGSTYNNYVDFYLFLKEAVEEIIRQLALVNLNSISSHRIINLSKTPLNDKEDE